ncbi:hypothetical protein ZEAMMB73_Zm00001d004088 [Zea mays]|uniref:Uncharacterized protein n=1 Tax=Zea mays TaxID=4577 RepID=A0A1D6EDD3_MAIZE|nr:hypothetical protein ZEAMMB73_Zm00001d004088 [Zea mays]
MRSLFECSKSENQEDSCTFELPLTWRTFSVSSICRNVLRRLGAFMLVNLPKKKGVLRLQMLVVCLRLSVIVNLFLLFSINLCLWSCSRNSSQLNMLTCYCGWSRLRIQSRRYT